jgi:hypothetical protein
MISAPNYTQTPNELFDKFLPMMGEAELKVTLAIVRDTLGWHCDEHEMSLSYLQEKTGLSRQAVINGTAAGMERGTIQRRQSGQTYAYSLAIQSLEVVNGVDQSTKKTSQRSRPVEQQSSQRSRPEVVNEVDTINKGKKKEIKEKVSLPLSPAELYRRTMAAEQLEALDAANVDLVTFRAMVDEILDATGKAALAEQPTQMGQRALNEAKETALTAIGMGFKTPQDIIQARQACPWDDPHNSQIIGYLGKKPKAAKVDQRDVPKENRVKPGAAAMAMENIRRRRLAMEAA